MDFREAILGQPATKSTELMIFTNSILKLDPNYTGRVTVPVLWDIKTNTIVNNKSAEIMRMLNSEFNAFARYPRR